MMETSLQFCIASLQPFWKETRSLDLKDEKSFNAHLVGVLRCAHRPVGRGAEEKRPRWGPRDSALSSAQNQDGESSSTANEPQQKEGRTLSSVLHQCFDPACRPATTKWKAVAQTPR